MVETDLQANTWTADCNIQWAIQPQLAGQTGYQYGELEIKRTARLKLNYVKFSRKNVEPEHTIFLTLMYKDLA